MFVLDFTRENKWLFVCLIFGARSKCAMGLKYLFQSHQLCEQVSEYIPKVLIP